MKYIENKQAAEIARNPSGRAQIKWQVGSGGVRYLADTCQMVNQRGDAKLEKNEIQLRKAQNAKKRADTTIHKSFHDEIKAAYEGRHARLAAKKKLLKEQAKTTSNYWESGTIVYTHYEIKILTCCLLLVI